MTARQITAIAAIGSAIFLAAGCASTGATSTPPPAAATSAPVAAASAVPAEPSASAMCTTHACIAKDLDDNLVGIVAKDESVTTKAVCYKRTVKYHRAADTYSATCTITYSDGSTATGTGNLLVSQQQVTFEPTG